MEELTGQAYLVDAVGRVVSEGQTRDPVGPSANNVAPITLAAGIVTGTYSIRAIFDKAADGTVLADAFLRDVVVPPPTTIAEPHGRGAALKAVLLFQGVVLAGERANRWVMYRVTLWWYPMQGCARGPQRRDGATQTRERPGLRSLR